MPQGAFIWLWPTGIISAASGQTKHRPNRNTADTIRQRYHYVLIIYHTYCISRNIDCFLQNFRNFLSLTIVISNIRQHSEALSPFIDNISHCAAVHEKMDCFCSLSYGWLETTIFSGIPDILLTTILMMIICMHRLRDQKSPSS